MQYVTSVVAAVALTSSITLAPMQASASSRCADFQGTEVCQETLTPTVHRVSWTVDDDNWIWLDLSCTDREWLIHQGRGAGFPFAERDQFAAGYCERAGSMFSF